MFSFLTGSSSNAATDKSSSNPGDEYHRRPLLIIPGFMSSGLQIEESAECPTWKGKRLWLNIGSLGLEKLSRSAIQKPWERLQRGLVGTTSDPILSVNPGGKEDLQQKEQQQGIIRSMWVRHMMLQEDLKSEQNGVRVRAIPGLDGVNYLYPSFLTNMITYVFGPLIEFLVTEGGYTAEVDLQAAPWDWRIPPCELQTRDQYFTKTIQQIEDMYQACGQVPIVILGHSLGSKVAHYLLVYAKQHKGQAWIDQHIYSYMPVSGTHIGVPKAIKQAVLVDHSCLDPFLTFEEEVIFGRSLGSTPWMFPTQLSPESPPVAWVKRQTLLEITFTRPMEVQALVKNRRPNDRPTEYMLQVALGDAQDKSSIRLLSTRFLKGDGMDGKANFTTETFCFVLPSTVDSKALEQLTLQLYLREPGLTKSGKDQLTQRGTALVRPFSCVEWINRIVGFILELICCVFDLAVFPLNLLNQMTVEASAVLAVSEPLALQGLAPNVPRTETTELVHIHDSHRSCFHQPHEKRTATLEIQVLWKPYDDLSPKERLCLDVATPNAKHNYRLSDKQSNDTYHGMSGHDFMYQEGPRMQSYLNAIGTLYDQDPYGPLTSCAVQAPPVQRVHAVYGINIPTEVAAFYHRIDACHSTRQSLPNYQLDPSPGISLEPTTDRYAVDGYLLKEIPSPSDNHPSGDGTVPYWCLASIQNWKDSVGSLTVVELDKAEHREILGSKAFQQEVLRYCRYKKESV